jgi:hypothetical protein
MECEQQGRGKQLRSYATLVLLWCWSLPFNRQWRIKRYLLGYGTIYFGFGGNYCLYFQGASVIVCPADCYLRVFLFEGYLTMRSVPKLHSVKCLDDWCIGKQLEGNRRDVIGVESRHLLQEQNKTMKNLNQGSRCSSRNSNRVPSEYKPKASPLEQPVRYQSFGEYAPSTCLVELQSATLKMQPCILVGGYKRFVGSHCLCHQDRSEVLYSEDGGNMFLLSVSNHLPDYTVL